MQRTIKGIRADLGLNQDEMAKKLGMSRTTYIHKENGNVPLLAKELILISKLANVPMEEIEVKK